MGFVDGYGSPFELFEGAGFVDGDLIACAEDVEFDGFFWFEAWGVEVEGVLFEDFALVV